MGNYHVFNTNGTNTLDFTYDVSGSPLTLTHNGTLYHYYITNLQGDVIAILDRAGYPMVRYTYDAWGNPLTTTGSMASTLGQYNPIRYRGYYYDSDTGFYYLQSRYYDPMLGRFLNADGYMSTGQGVQGNNMFVYCLNAPVFRVDVAGFFSITCNLDGDVDPQEDKNEFLGGGNNNDANTSRSISAGSSYSGSSSGGSKTGYSTSQSTNGNKVNVQMPNNSSKAITYGQGKAGKLGTGTYVQLSSDGRDAVISWTEYNQYSYPEYRVDLNHTHGGIGAPHMHRFETVCISGNFHLNKLPTIEVNLVCG